MKKHRIPAGLCALTLAFSGIVCDAPAAGFVLTAYADVQSGNLGDNLTWTINEYGLLTVSGEGEWDNDARIPADIKAKVTAAVVQKGITTIGFRAFDGCNYMETVTLPDSVTEIGEYAFSNCSKLADVTIPESVTQIGGAAFSNTPWMKEKQKEDPLVVVNHILINGQEATGDIVIPEGVTAISRYVFFSNGKITSVTFPESLTMIDSFAFSYCSSLESVTLPSGVSFIGLDAFADCSHLTDVTILNPECEFYKNDPALFSSEYHSNGDEPPYFKGVMHGYEGSTAQAYAGMWGVTFEALEGAPAETGKIGDNLTWTLTDRSVLTISGTGEWQDGEKIPEEILRCADSVIIKNGVTSIGTSAFGNSVDGYYISSVSIPDTVTSIGERAFEGCALETLTIPASVRTIGNIAFCGCSKLTSVTLPASVESIGKYAFCGCEKLKTFTVLNPECDIFDNEVTVSNEDEYCPCEDPRYRGTIRGYENSTAQAYAEKYGYTFEALEKAAEPNPDMNGDEKITAADAQTILTAVAEMLAGNDPELTPEQLAAADVDGNGQITALDAQYTLSYFLYHSVLETQLTWEDIIG